MSFHLSEESNDTMGILWSSNSNTLTLIIECPNHKKGCVNVLITDTVERVRQKILDEFDSDMVPDRFCFLIGNVRISRKQEKTIKIKDLEQGSILSIDGMSLLETLPSTKRPRYDQIIDEMIEKAEQDLARNGNIGESDTEVFSVLQDKETKEVFPSFSACQLESFGETRDTSDEEEMDDIDSFSEEDSEDPPKPEEVHLSYQRTGTHFSEITDQTSQESISESNCDSPGKESSSTVDEFQDAPEIPSPPEQKRSTQYSFPLYSDDDGEATTAEGICSLSSSQRRLSQVFESSFSEVVPFPSKLILELSGNELNDTE